MEFNENYMKNMITLISQSLNVILIVGILIFASKMGYLGRVLVLFKLNYLELPTDTLSSRDWWQDQVKYQADVAQNRQFDTCLFGDSISQSLENTLGNNTFNFAINGMSTISQLEQLTVLTTAKVRCNTAIIALGTNDASYRTMDYQFKRNMLAIITTIKNKMQAKRVILIPAFYSTIEASQDPQKAGSIAKVDEINAVIRQIGDTEKLLVFKEGIEPLFEEKALKKTLTVDGVHLNPEGRKIYREALLKLLNS